MLRRAAARPSGAVGACVRGRPDVCHQYLHGNPARDVQRVLGFGHRLGACLGVTLARLNGPIQRPASYACMTGA